MVFFLLVWAMAPKKSKEKRDKKRGKKGKKNKEAKGSKEAKVSKESKKNKATDSKLKRSEKRLAEARANNKLLAKVAGMFFRLLEWLLWHQPPPCPL